jgi:hypothetical protein
MLLGWADRRASAGDPLWSSRWGIYRQGGGYGADAVAPITQDTGIDSVIREIRGYVGTFCIGASGATFPWSMGSAYRYLTGRSYVGIQTHWNSLGIHEGWIKDWAAQSIQGRGVPAIIGTGWLSHYPMAYGYAWERRIVRTCAIWCWDTVQYCDWFYVNQGWGGYGNEWIAASTWFAGSIF